MLISLLLSASFTMKAQIPDSVQQKRTKFYSKRLGINDAKASQVDHININYKSAVKNVMQNSSLSDKEKRAQIDQLISQKDLQLAAVLTPLELKKAMPSSERKREVRAENTDSVTKTKQVAFIEKLLTVDQRKALQVVSILSGYNTEVRALVANKGIDSQTRRVRLDLVNETKNKRLSTLLTQAQLALIIPERKKAAQAILPKYANLQITLSKEVIAIRDSFERQLKIVAMNKGISSSEKQAKISALIAGMQKSIRSANFRNAGVDKENITLKQ